MKELIRKRIKEKFKTIENFSKHVGIPRTTVNFVLKNGVEMSSYEMVNKILKELDIYPGAELPVAVDEDLIRFLGVFSSLDEIGKHTVMSVAETEHRRIYADAPRGALIAAYGSIDSGKQLTEDEKEILDLVQKIKKKDNNEK